MDTYIDNFLAETSIRYGGFGGIAYHYISDTYVALFSRFIPCGVWEAVYLIEGLLANTSDIQPSTVHADTQSQNFPVFALATLFGFDLMPRIRNFKDLIFFRASETIAYPHIDQLFGESGRNVIDWKLIEKHWMNLMQVAISISEGRLSSATLMRRLRSNSRKRRAGEADQVQHPAGQPGRLPQRAGYLRHRATVGRRGLAGHRRPAWPIAPYLRARISRFGAYATDDLHRQPDPFDPLLKEVGFIDVDLAA